MNARPLSLWLLAAVTLCINASPGAAQGSGSAQLRPGLQVEIREERYEVEGERLRDVIARLNEMRLEGERARLSQGLTVYRINPRWQYQPDNGSCAVTTVEVMVDITVKLPRWPGFATATGDERLRWRAILEGIRNHEYQHRDMTVDSGGELVVELTALRASTCRALLRAAEAAVAIADERLSERHAELDGG